MNSEMTSVYSGGLLYEYSMETNNFGIVQISGSSVSELPEFAKFASALSANPAPTGNGGFTSTTAAVTCPTQGPNWMVDSTLLPAIPDGAKQVRSLSRPQSRPTPRGEFR
jgi:1,3-beta-glucanosyltransferase GAS5